MLDNYNYGTYDYIVVGSGSAGCVVANRLTEHPNVRVLLLEAGPDAAELGDDLRPSLEHPSGWVELLSSKIDWHYSSEPEPHLEDRQLRLSRGKIVGGSSILSNGLFLRGHRRDFDEWAELGNPGWSYYEVLPYFIKQENNFGRNLAPGYHGKKGPLAITDLAPSAATEAFLNACRALGHAANSDFNGPQAEGVGPVQGYIRDGMRVNAANAYLDDAVRSRPNLTIETHAFAHRLIHDLTADCPRIVGVEYQDRSGGNVLKRVRAEKEVIVCCGSYETPKLLMMSGMGPADELSRHGIPTLIDLPGVGGNLQDHLATPLSYLYADKVRPLRIEPLAQIGALFINTHGGGRPDLQLIFNAFLQQQADQPSVAEGYTVAAVLANPRSRGRVRLRSPDPSAPPSIQSGFLSASHDREAMMEALRISLEVLEGRELAGFRGQRLSPPADIRSDTELHAYVRHTASSLHHAAGTCAMGPEPHDRELPAVVDAQLRVHGVSGLRIVDASIMPSLTTGEPCTATVMIAEKAADMILAAQHRTTPPFETEARSDPSWVPPREPHEAGASPVGSLLDLPRQMARFSWAMSLFGARQMTHMMDPRNWSQGPAGAFGAVTDSMVDQLGGPAKQMFQTGERLQNTLLDFMSSGFAGASRTAAAEEPRSTSAASAPPPQTPAPSADVSAGAREGFVTREELSPSFGEAASLAQSHDLEVHGARLHYLEAGVGDPILFLHGNVVSSHLWRHVISHLRPYGRCLALDLVGMGRSDRPASEYRFFDHLRYVEGFIEKMGLQNLTLVMHEWGGPLGVACAVRQPQRLRGLVFLETILRPYQHWGQVPDLLRQLWQQSRTPNLGMYQIVGENILLRDFLPAIALGKLSEEDLAVYRAAFADPAHRHVLWRWLQEIPIAGEPADVDQALTEDLEQLGRLNLPKLLLYSHPGALVSAEDVAWAQRSLSELATVELGEGLFLLPEDHGATIAAAIVAWLETAVRKQLEGPQEAAQWTFPQRSQVG